MIELPMSLDEYDAILNSISYVLNDHTYYAYGSDTAQILADRFEDCNMPLHVDMFRHCKSEVPLANPIFIYHPYSITRSINSPEEFISLLHFGLSRQPINPAIALGLKRYNVVIDPESTIANPILIWI